MLPSIKRHANRSPWKWVMLWILVPFLSLLDVVSAEEGPVTVQRAQMLMGTVVTATAMAPDEDTARRAVEAGLDEVSRLEQLLSTWIPTSELSRVNAAAGVSPVPVSADTMELLQESLRVTELTEGGFNVVIGPAVLAWRVADEPRVPSDSELAQIKPLIDPANLELDPEASSVYLTRSGMQIDVGGIGKGFAADLAIERMRAAGAQAGVMALSGDIKTFGRMPGGQPFLFGIQHPRQDGVLLGHLQLENEAISTAGDYQRFFMKAGVRYHHILDPRTLRPARLCQSVTVIAERGVMADGLDTGIFVLGPDRGMALVERLPGIEAVMVDATGKLLVSSGLKDRFVRETPARSP